MKKTTMICMSILLLLAGCNQATTVDPSEETAIQEGSEVTETDKGMEEEPVEEVQDERPGDEELDQGPVDAMEVDTWFGVTSSRVKLRQGPSTETDALAIDYAFYELEAPSYDFLFLGQRVTVLDQSSEKETIGDYEPSYWYLVEAAITDTYNVKGWVFGAFVEPWKEDMADTYDQTLADDYASARPLSQQIKAKVVNSYKIKREETLAKYPFLQADVSDYEAYLLSLDVSDFSSLIDGAEQAASYATMDNGDELLYAFSDFQEAVLNLSIFHGYEYLVDNEAILEDVGFMVLYSEGDPEVHTDPGFIQRYFGDMVSPIIGDHIKLLVKEQNQHPDTYVFSDAAMTISWEDLAKRIRDNESFVSKYADDPFFQYIGLDRQNINEFYVRIYLGDFNMDNTPIYDWEDKSIREEAIQSYKDYLNNHPDSRYASMVEEVLSMFEGNDFIYDSEAFSDKYEGLFTAFE